MAWTTSPQDSKTEYIAFPSYATASLATSKTSCYQYTIKLSTSLAKEKMELGSGSRAAQNGKGRKFFQQMQPTFAIDIPRTTVTRHEFLDHLDPTKSTVVRKKAREWVNRNKENSRQKRERMSITPPNSVTGEINFQVKPQTKLQRQESYESEFELILSPPRPVGIDSFDPFHLLPKVGRKYEHIIDFFLNTDMEEIPCSDDKYSKQSVVPFSTDNTVLGNMAKNETSFILWLYATVSIRDGMMGHWDTEEVLWFYAKAVKELSKTLEEDAKSGVYSDNLLNSVGCITATASFSGAFKMAELHRDAMIRVLSERGKGDILKGLLLAPQWTVKAMQWCEMMVATQIVEIPKIPYHCCESTKPAPPAVVQEAARRTNGTLKNLPKLSKPLENIVHLLHRLGILYAEPPPGAKIDSFVIKPLFEAEHALLHTLTAQKQPDHGFSEVEILLTETLQLYLWTGPRVLPPQTRLCDLLVARIMRALLPIFFETVPELDLENSPATAASLHQGTESILANFKDSACRPWNHSLETNNAVIWSLALGTMVSKSLDRPEHLWFREHLALQFQTMGFDQDERAWRDFLRLFPTTDGFGWIDLTKLYSWFARDGT